MTADGTREPHPNHDTSVSEPRSRVVTAATALLLEGGVGSLTRARVSSAGRVTQPEFDHLFHDLDTLVEAIVDARLRVVLRSQEPSLKAVNNLPDLDRWRSRLLEEHTSDHGCALGSLIYHLARRDDRGHRALAAAFMQWQALLTAALTRIQAAGGLDAAVVPEDLAIGVMAAIQGGFLLAHTARDSAHLHAALDMAMSYVRSHAQNGAY
jgi:TetR/AcrR family transcriptional repressor of nem operon